MGRHAPGHAHRGTAGGNGGYRNLWLNLGHGALGFTLACGSGRLLAEQIGRRPPSIDTSGLLPRGALAG